MLIFSILSSGFLCELPGLPVELGELLGEVRSLRAQLQNSVQENSALKQLELHKQLEQKLGVGSPRTPSLSALSASPQRENFYRRQLLHGESDAARRAITLQRRRAYLKLSVLWFAVYSSLPCVCVISRPSSVSSSQGHRSV